MNLARQVSAGDKDARILVISADLRSALGNSMPDNPTREDIVAVSLFRDAASTTIVGRGGGFRDNEENSENCPRYEIVTGASRIVEDTEFLVNYHETNEGAIRLHLDKQLPEFIGKAEPDFVASLLDKGRRVLRGKTCQEDDDNTMMPRVQEMDVLCHTGGPRVLREVAKSLGVTTDSMFSSWEVMKKNGNLSGASNLCVLDHHNLSQHKTSE